MAKNPLNSLLKDFQERKTRRETKLKIVENVKKEYRKVVAENENIKKNIKSVKAEDQKLLDLIAADKMEITSMQIETSFLMKRIAEEEQLNTELKQKLILLDKQELEAINNCQQVISDHQSKYGIGGSVIQEKAFIDNENEMEYQILNKEKEAIVARIYDLKKKQKNCDELDVKKIEFLNDLELKHKDRITHQNNLKQLENEIIGIKKEIESRESVRKNYKTNALVETKVLSTQEPIEMEINHSLAVEGTKRGFNSKETKRRKRMGHTSRSGSLERWFRPQVKPKSEQSTSKDKEWIVLPNEERSRIESKIGHIEIPGKSELIVPLLSTNENFFENKVINKDLSMARSFTREMEDYQKIQEVTSSHVGALGSFKSSSHLCRKQKKYLGQPTKSFSLDRFQTKHSNKREMEQHQQLKFSNKTNNEKETKNDNLKTTYSDGLIVPQKVAEKSRETLKEIAENYDINKAPSFIKSFIKEMSAMNKSIKK